MAHLFDCQTRWGDMDAYLHLNNGVYVDYLQEARVDFLHSGEFAYMLGDEPQPGVEGPNRQAILVTGHQVEYLRPAEHGHPLQVRLVVDQVGAARFTLAYDIVSDDRLVARARTVLCPFDLESDAIRRLADDEKAWFCEHAEPIESLPTVAKVRLGDQPAHEYAFRVRWSDLDSYRHANNVKYYDYVQEARIDLMRDLLEHRPAQSERPGQWIVVRQDMDYAVQMDFRPEPYVVRTAVQDIGQSSLTLAAEILDPTTGVVHASSRTVLVHSAVTGPEAIPSWIREALTPLRLPVPVA